MHCANTPTSLSVSYPSIPQHGNSSVMMCHRTVNSASCLRTNWCLPFSVSLWEYSQKILLKRTTTDRIILSTTPLTLFEVLLNMTDLPVSQVLHQSSCTSRQQQQEWIPELQQTLMLIASTSILKRDRIREMWETLPQSIRLSVCLCRRVSADDRPAFLEGDGLRVSADGIKSRKTEGEHVTLKL